jgi:hypothetical protein
MLLPTSGIPSRRDPRAARAVPSMHQDQQQDALTCASSGTTRNRASRQGSLARGKYCRRQGYSASLRRSFSQSPDGCGPPAQPKDARHRPPRHRQARRYRGSSAVEFYNLRRRHSSIGYLSPMEFERRRHALAADPDAPEPAAVLAAVKDKPFGRPQEAAVLDRRSARRPHQCAGRDGRMAPPGAELKNASTQEGNMPSHQ